MPIFRYRMLTTVLCAVDRGGGTGHNLICRNVDLTVDACNWLAEALFRMGVNWTDGRREWRPKIVELCTEPNCGLVSMTNDYCVCRMNPGAADRSLRQSSTPVASNRAISRYRQRSPLARRRWLHKGALAPDPRAHLPLAFHPQSLVFDNRPRLKISNSICALDTRLKSLFQALPCSRFDSSSQTPHTRPQLT